MTRDEPPLYSDDEFRQRLEADLRATIARKNARQAARGELNRRRAHGLYLRHKNKLNGARDAATTSPDDQAGGSAEVATRGEEP